MIKSVQFQIKQASKTRMFRLALVLAIILGGWNILTNILKEIHFIKEVQFGPEYQGANILVHVRSIYCGWLGRGSSNIDNVLYQVLFPILAVLPFGSSLFEERRSGYIYQMISRMGVKTYYLSKMIATGLLGGIFAMLPLLISLIGLLFFKSSVAPDPSFMMYYGIMPGHSYSHLFYSKFALLFLGVIMLYAFCYGVMSALMSYSITFFVRKRFGLFIVLFSPLLILQLFDFMLKRIFDLVILSPLHNIKMLVGNQSADIWIVIAQLGVIILLSYILIRKRAYHEELL